MICWVPVLGVVLLLQQGDGATLTGSVRDARTGEPVLHARVVLPDLNRAAASGPDGRYVFRDLSPGLQHVEVRRLGYTARTLHAFVPPAGTLRIDVSLEPDPVPLRGVELLFPVPIRGAEPDRDHAVAASISLSDAAVRNHPLLAEPDALAALDGGVVVMDPEAPAGLHVRGGRADQVAFLLDGIPVLNPYHSSGLFSAWNPDALARVRLDPARPDVDSPDVLSGIVAAETRQPGEILRSQGAISTRQSRFSVDGPVPFLGGGFLVSGRRAFPGYPLPDGERSYLRGGGSDWLMKLQTRLVGGELRLLRFGNRDAASTAASAVGEGGEDPTASARRNHFAWSGSSTGVDWSATLRRDTRLRVRAWQAMADASSSWLDGDEGAATLASSRKDLGASAEVAIGDTAAATTLGLRATRNRMHYAVRFAGAPAEADDRSTGSDVLAASIEHSRELGSAVRMEAGMLAAIYASTPRLAPRLELSWAPQPAVEISVNLARTHQAEQSLADPESVVGHVFPPGLYVGPGIDGAPLARGDQAILVARLRPRPGIRVGAEAYRRRMRGLVIAAPLASGSFALDGFEVGSGSAIGGALDVSFSRPRYALLGSYGVERVRYFDETGSPVPASAPGHTLALGGLARPTSSMSLSASLTGIFGRRATAVSGPFEWEACNFLDRGCEFAGTPRRVLDPAGVRPPAYLRMDVGARKHWHLEMGPRTAEIGLYLRVSNLLGRRNLLTEQVDPVTGAREWIEMQSRVPLVAGLDWRF